MDSCWVSILAMKILHLYFRPHFTFCSYKPGSVCFSVKHHTNFIIAHHKVPVVETRVVHVPVEKTKIVPIIVHKGQHRQPHHAASYPHHAASSQAGVRVTSLGKLRPSANGTSLQVSPSLLYIS